MLASIVNTANAWVLLIAGVLGILGIVMSVGHRWLKWTMSERDFFRELRVDATEAKDLAVRATTMLDSQADLIRKQSNDIARLATVTGNLADMFGKVGKAVNGHDDEIENIYSELHTLRLRMDRKETAS